jgi:hypothetical protein
MNTIFEGSYSSKAGFYHAVSRELSFLLKCLRARGYTVNLDKGFVDRQILHLIDLDDYQRMRDLHFIFHGLNGNWVVTDQSEKERFEKLREFTEKFLSKIP